MQKIQAQDLWRAFGWTFGIAGLLFAAGLSRNMTLDQLLSPVALAVMFGIGLVASIADLIIVLRNPRRLAMARGETSPSPMEVRQFQADAQSSLKLYGMISLAISIVVIAGAVIYLLSM